MNDDDLYNRGLPLDQMWPPQPEKKMNTQKLNQLLTMKRESEAVLSALKEVFGYRGTLYDALKAAIEKTEGELFSINSAIEVVEKEGPNES